MTKTEVATQQDNAMDALPAIIESRQRLPQLSEQVAALVVASDADKKLAQHLGHHIDAEVKTIREAHDEVVRATDAAHKAAIAKRTAELAPWLELQGAVKGKVDEWAFKVREAERRENERQAKLAAERAAREAERLAAQAAEAEAKGIDPEAFIPPLAPPIIPRVESAPPTTHFETGSVTETWAWTAEVIPGMEDAVERQYCSPDLAKIRGAVKAGLRISPGLRIYEERRERHTRQ